MRFIWCDSSQLIRLLVYYFFVYTHFIAVKKKTKRSESNFNLE